ncbi:autophagy-related protein 13-domain-containing protein [Entophlyctis helioformis]|nr:autophagy-related protein 13-domain-containing protein [Entophlyctis helioformis]
MPLPAGELSSSVTSAAAGKASKTDQLLQNFYAKTAQVIVQSRLAPAGASNTGPGSAGAGESASASSLEPVARDGGGSAKARKANKWFNLEMDDVDPLREEMRFWKQQIANTSQSPPLIIDIFLDLSSLTSAHHLMLKNTATMQRFRIGKELLTGSDDIGRPTRKTKILLETWQLSLSHTIPSQPPELPIVYKKSIVFFRALSSMLRLIPAYRLCRRARRTRQSPLSVSYRISTSRASHPDEAGLDQLHLGSDMWHGISEYSFGSVDTPLGMFNLHVAYRLECDFSVDSPEAALSHRYSDLEESYFAANKAIQRQSSHRKQQQQQPREASSSGDDGHAQSNHTSAGSRQSRSTGKHSLLFNTAQGVSPATATTTSAGMVPPMSFRSDLNGLNGMHFHDHQGSPGYVAFTPPSDTSSAPTSGLMMMMMTPQSMFINEPPPFSTQPDSASFYEPPEALFSPLAASPPFAMTQTQLVPQPSRHLSNAGTRQSPSSQMPSAIGRISRQPSLELTRSRRSLELVRRPSYTFSTASPMNPTHDAFHPGSLGPLPPPLMFTPSSSFAHPVLQAYKLSPPALSVFHTPDLMASPFGAAAFDTSDAFRAVDTSGQLRITDGSVGSSAGTGTGTGASGGVSASGQATLQQQGVPVLGLQLNSSSAGSLSRGLSSKLDAGPSLFGNISGLPSVGLAASSTTANAAASRRNKSQNALNRFKQLRNVNMSFTASLVQSTARLGETEGLSGSATASLSMHHEGVSNLDASPTAATLGHRRSPRVDEAHPVRQSPTVIAEEAEPSADTEVERGVTIDSAGQAQASSVKPKAPPPAFADSSQPSNATPADQGAAVDAPAPSIWPESRPDIPSLSFSVPTPRIFPSGGDIPVSKTPTTAARPQVASLLTPFFQPQQLAAGRARQPAESSSRQPLVHSSTTAPTEKVAATPAPVQLNHLDLAATGLVGLSSNIDASTSQERVRSKSADGQLGHSANSSSRSRYSGSKAGDQLGHSHGHGQDDVDDQDRGRRRRGSAHRRAASDHHPDDNDAHEGAEEDDDLLFNMSELDLGGQGRGRTHSAE